MDDFRQRRRIERYELPRDRRGTSDSDSASDRRPQPEAAARKKPREDEAGSAGPRRRDDGRRPRDDERAARRADEAAREDEFLEVEQQFNREMENARRDDLRQKRVAREKAMKLRIAHLQELQRVSDEKAQALVALMKAREEELHRNFANRLQEVEAGWQEKLTLQQDHYERLLTDKDKYRPDRPLFGLEIDDRRGDEPGLRVLSASSVSAEAGLRPNDLIHQIVLPCPVRSREDFQTAIAKVNVGERVQFGILREGQPFTVVVIAGGAQKEFPVRASPMRPALGSVAYRSPTPTAFERPSSYVVEAPGRAATTAPGPLMRRVVGEDGTLMYHESEVGQPVGQPTQHDAQSYRYVVVSPQRAVPSRALQVERANQLWSDEDFLTAGDRPFSGKRVRVVSPKVEERGAATSLGSEQEPKTDDLQNASTGHLVVRRVLLAKDTSPTRPAVTPQPGGTMVRAAGEERPVPDVEANFQPAFTSSSPFSEAVEDVVAS